MLDLDAIEARPPVQVATIAFVKQFESDNGTLRCETGQRITPFRAMHAALEAIGHDALVAELRAARAEKDELTAENKELKLDLAAAEHYTTDDLTSPARLCVKCRCPWPCEFTFRAVVGPGGKSGGGCFDAQAPGVPSETTLAGE